MRSGMLQALAEDGYAVEDSVLCGETVDLLRDEIARLAGPRPRIGGIRNAAGKSAVLRDVVAGGPPGVLARGILGSSARAVKVTVFDKTPDANWKVPWHQDLTIAVRCKEEVEGFGPWSVKDGIPHVQPPMEILAQMLSVRVHLDDTPAENGALRVVPGSHLSGRLSREEISRLRCERGEAVCAVPEGGAMLMRPLLLHASSPTQKGGRRRVIHIEYAVHDLPFGLEWAL